jgi:hypothetical protein
MKVSELKILTGERKSPGISSHFLDNNCSAETDEVKAMTQERGDSIRFPKGHNRKIHRGGTKKGDRKRIQLDLGSLSNNPVRREAASERVPRAQQHMQGLCLGRRIGSVGADHIKNLKNVTPASGTTRMDQRPGQDN